jgi:hypothetical protein
LLHSEAPEQDGDCRRAPVLLAALGEWLDDHSLLFRQQKPQAFGDQ